jgi:N6-L-threonylcarbamoyladenine synthase
VSIKTLLAVETSCDETSVAIVQAEFTQGSWQNTSPERIRVLSHVVESQTSHVVFGGVVPEVAARDHLLKMTPLALQAIAEAKVSADDLDGIAVTLGPGLIGALMVGTLFAQGLSTAINKPLVGINHVDAHLAPALMLQHFNTAEDVGQWLPVELPVFPALALTVSGGHCHLSLLRSENDRTLLGCTADDACGEAFDKVAKLLGLPYPGGPHLEKLAQSAEVNSAAFKFRTALADKSNRHGFSYSGLKTQVLDAVRKQLGHPMGKINGSSLPEDVKASIAQAFQQAALGQLLDRLQNAIEDHRDVRSILVAGGVAANKIFRSKLAEQTKLEVRFAPMSLCSDNATMIALHAFLPGMKLSSPHPFSRYQYSS